MDNKVKLAGFCCAVMVCIGIYIDTKPILPLDVANIQTITYDSLLRSAKNNDVAAQYALGTYYLYGNNKKRIPLDKTKALDWFKKAAIQSHGPSAFEYGRLIAASNPKEAQLYYDLAIKSGFGPAIFAQSQLKLRDSTPAAVKEGLALLIYAADTVKDPVAKAYLAVLQYEGAGVKKDRVEAILNMQNATIHAPTPETKKDWDAKQVAWFATLTSREQNELNDRLMMGRVNSPEGLVEDKSSASPTIADLMANFPINSSKPVSK